MSYALAFSCHPCRPRSGQPVLHCRASFLRSFTHPWPCLSSVNSENGDNRHCSSPCMPVTGRKREGSNLEWSHLRVVFPDWGRVEGKDPWPGYTPAFPTGAMVGQFSPFITHCLRSRAHNCRHFSPDRQQQGPYSTHMDMCVYVCVYRGIMTYL